jgi:hypothetical protein
MADETTKADIQQTFFEYRGAFKEPIVGFWFERRQGEVVRAMHKALAPWNVALENITWNQTPKNAGEIQLTFAVPSLVAGVQVSLGGISTTAINPDWSRAPQFVALYQTAVDTLKGVVEQELQSQQATLGFHVKPGVKPFREILSQFVNARMFGGENANMFGVSAYFPDFSIVFDASFVVPEGLFIKLTRIFPSSSRFEEMASTIYKDEEAALHRLGLELQ